MRSQNVTIEPEEVQAVKSLLWPGEEVELTVRQRRVGPGGSIITPTSVIATDKRLIIMNRASLGIRQDYEVILYRQITSVRFEHGLISSSVFVRVQGYDTDRGLLKGGGKQEGEIDGLNNADARQLSDFINRKLAAMESDDTGGEGRRSASVAPAPRQKSGLYCSECGALNEAGAHFCTQCGAALERAS